MKSKYGDNFNGNDEELINFDKQIKISLDAFLERGIITQTIYDEIESGERLPTRQEMELLINDTLVRVREIPRWSTAMADTEDNYILFEED